MFGFGIKRFGFESWFHDLNVELSAKTLYSHPTQVYTMRTQQQAVNDLVNMLVLNACRIPDTLLSLGVEKDLVVGYGLSGMLHKALRVPIFSRFIVLYKRSLLIFNL